MEGKAPAIKVLLNEADPEEIARTMTYYEYLSGDNLQRLETFNETLTELQATRQQKLQAQAEVIRLEEQVSERQQSLQTQKPSLSASAGASWSGRPRGAWWQPSAAPWPRGICAAMASC